MPHGGGGGRRGGGAGFGSAARGPGATGAGGSTASGSPFGKDRGGAPSRARSGRTDPKGKADARGFGFSPSEALTTGLSVAGIPGALVGFGAAVATQGEGPSTKGPTMSGGGSTPTPSGPRGNATLGSEDLPSVPSAENSGDALSAAEDAQRERDARRRGRASTILTGGQGLATAAPVARRTLMGS